MKCPNLSDPKVAAIYSKYQTVLGDNIGTLSWNRNNQYGIEKTKEGKPSHFFYTLNSVFDFNEAVFHRAYTFTDDFISKFGNGIKDSEGEPLLYNDNNQKYYYKGEKGKIYLDEAYVGSKEFLKAKGIDPYMETRNNFAAAEILKATTEKTSEVFGEALKGLFPGIQVSIDSNEEVKALTNVDNVDGFIDEEGVLHINKAYIDPKTGIHELGHLLKPLLSRANSKAYLAVMNRIDEGLKDSSSDISSLARLMKKAYDKEGVQLSKEELKEEVFAELLALNTPSRINDLYMKAGEIPETTLWDKIKEFVWSLYDTVKSIFKGSPDTIEELFYSLHQDILKGRNTWFSEPNKAFLRDYFSDTGDHHRIAHDAKVKANIAIKDASDIHKVLIGDSYQFYDENKRADIILAMMKENPIKGDRYEYTLNNITHKFLKSKSDEDLKVDIIKYLVRPLMDQQLNKKDRIVNALQGKRKLTDVESALKVIGGSEASSVAIEDFIFYTGLSSGYKAIYKLSDLKNNSNPNLQALYSKSFEGSDPIIIVHNMSEDGTLDISVIDTTYDNINPKKMLLYENNIFGKFLSDQEYFNRTGDLNYYNDYKLRNTDEDIKNLQLGLFLLHANKATKGKIRVRNVGTLSTSRKATNAKMVINLNGLMNNISMMKGVPGLMSMVEDPYLKSLIEDSSNYDNNIRQSFLSVLETYVKEVSTKAIEDPYMTPSMGRVMLGFFKGEKTERELLQLIDTMTYHIHSKNADASVSKLYAALTNAAREIRNHEIGMTDAAKSFTSLNTYLMTANAVSDPSLQDVVEAVKDAKHRIVHKVMSDIEEFKGAKNDGLLYKVLQRSYKLHPEVAAQYFVDKGSVLFNRLYKTKKVRMISDGKLKEETLITLPEIHHTLEDPETKKLFDEGVLSQDDLDFANKILDKQRTLMVQKIFHQKKLDKAQRSLFGSIKIGSKTEEFTMEDAERIYDNNFKRGHVVFISKSTSELFFSGKFKEAAKKYGRGLAMYDDSFEDVVNITDNKYDEVANYFGSQKTYDARLQQVGLTYNEGEMVLANPELNEMMSTNLWSTFVSLSQSINRKIEYENNVMPVARDSISFLTQMKMMGKSTDKTMQYLKEYIDGNAFKKNQDDDKEIEIVPGVKTRWSTIVRGFVQTYNKAVLPFRFGIGAFSMLFNMNRMFTESLSASLSKTEEFVPKLPSFLKAVKYMFVPKYFKMIKRLALKTQIWGREERDLLNSPFVNPTQKKILEQEFTNIWNYATDTFARTFTMVAALIEEGSMDAYSYNEESGEFEYDETKDRKFYDENGVLKPEMVAEYNRVKQSLIDEGYKVGDKLPIGIDSKEADRLKYISDKYIIGSFSPETRMQINNRWLGVLFSNFRLFSGDRLNNLGIGVPSNYSTKIGQKHKATTLPDGTVVSVREKIELESMHKSFMEMLKTVFKDGNITPEKFSTWYENQNASRRYNLAKTLIQLIMMGILAAAFGAMGDKDDDKKKANAWMMKFLGDILVAGTIIDVAKSPWPAIDALLRYTQQGNLEMMLPGSGFVKEVSGVIEEDDETNKNK